jgi:hypothetical protein
MVLRGEIFWKVILGISALIKEASETKQVPLIMQGSSEKLMSMRNGPSPDIKSASALILDF